MLGGVGDTSVPGKGVDVDDREAFRLLGDLHTKQLETECIAASIHELFDCGRERDGHAGGEVALVPECFPDTECPLTGDKHLEIGPGMVQVLLSEDQVRIRSLRREIGRMLHHSYTLPVTASMRLEDQG